MPTLRNTFLKPNKYISLENIDVGRAWRPWYQQLSSYQNPSMEMTAKFQPVQRKHQNLSQHRKMRILKHHHISRVEQGGLLESITIAIMHPYDLLVSTST